MYSFTARLLAVAARNVSRNTRRSLISAIAVFIGVGGVITLQGFLNSLTRWLVEDTVNNKLGAIQIHRRGYQDADTNQLDFDLADDPALRARIAAVPGVSALAPRISFEGMLNNGTVSSMFVATAIDPSAEYRVCPGRRGNVAPGSTPLDEKSGAGALIGAELAGSLDAKQGAVLTMLSAARNGASNALDVTVQGFLPSKLVIESKRMSTVTLAFAQDLLRMPGRITEYAVSVDDLDHVSDVARRLQAAVGGDYVVEDWMTLSPALRDRLAITKVILGIIVLILFLLVATGIINTMLMSVYERVREIGAMLAVGTRRRHVLLLFLAEAASLGLAGAALGAAAGASLVFAVGVHGFRFTPPGGQPTVFHPFVPPAFIGATVGFAVLGTVVAGLFPAWKASRLRPADALRSN